MDTGSTYSLLPRSLLQALGVQPRDHAKFRLSDGRTVEQDIGQTWLRIDGKSVITLVVFGDETASPLLGAYALEGLLLAPDPIGRRLVPVEGLLMSSRTAQKLAVNYRINGQPYEAHIEPNRTLLDQNPHTTEHEIREAIAGNLCRCTGYTKIVEAIAAAATAR